MTPTEKKYSQHIGKLYWSANREYDHDKGDYKPIYDLVMPISLQRRYGGSGRYTLTLQVIQFNANNGEGSDLPRGGHRQEQYNIEASYFETLFGGINHWHQGYFLAKTGELEKDVDQIKKAG